MHGDPESVESCVPIRRDLDVFCVEQDINNPPI